MQTITEKEVNAGLTQASDAAFINAFTADGTPIKISKADLASVVAGLIHSPKMVQNIMFQGGNTYYLGANSTVWYRRGLFLVFTTSQGDSLALIKVSFMPTESSNAIVFVSYVGDSSIINSYTFGYTRNGSTVKMYIRCENSSSSHIFVNAIAPDLIEQTTDTFSTTVTPTKIA